jgi:hypothetical protein
MTIGQNCVPDLSDYFFSHQIHSEREGERNAVHKRVFDANDEQ